MRLVFISCGGFLVMTFSYLCVRLGLVMLVWKHSVSVNSYALIFHFRLCCSTFLKGFIAMFVNLRLIEHELLDVLMICFVALGLLSSNIFVAFTDSCQVQLGFSR